MSDSRSTDLDEFWSVDLDQLLRRLDTGSHGLTTVEARERLGTVRALGRRVNTDLDLLARQLKNPVIVLLLVAATVSAVFEGIIDSLVIVAIIVVSALLGWMQERGAVKAIETLLQSVQVHVDVLRDGEKTELVEAEIVPGDVVLLGAGDVVPGDCRVISATRLSVDEAALTGESQPREKCPGVLPLTAAITERSNVLFHGTHVGSGRCRAVVVRCGADTEFGGLASSVVRTHVPTSFERGVAAYGMMLAEAAAILVAIVFAVTVARGQPLLESALFALALAVGITPQMLPVIVTVSLASGARQLARRQVIVKRLDAIEDIGSIDTLCVDKTGTLTVGTVGLARACDPSGAESEGVLELASWNAHLHSARDNPIDSALMAAHPLDGLVPALVAEVSFDFVRRMVSVIVEAPDGEVLVAKGDVTEISSRCCFAREDERVEAMETFRSLSDEGFRVLAVATRRVGEGEHDDPGIERDLELRGFLAFVDPVKHDAAEAVARLADLGVTVKVITGDNRLAARHAARAAGIPGRRVMTGADVRMLDDARLTTVAAVTDVFAEVDPITKQRIVRALSKSGRSVAFMGDGVNDAAALHAADVGISVDGGVDVAKQVSDVVLLDKDLTVLADAVRHGRRVFANTLTYVKVTTSANFGNMVSLVVASSFLSYLPLLPLQILLLNFLSDIPGVTIAADEVDAERVAVPGRWNVAEVRRFMVVYGLVSTAADMATFAVMLHVWDSGIAEVRTGWFTVSLLTEVVALLVLRTSRPAWRSRPGRALVGASFFVAAVAVLVPGGVLPDVFGFARLDGVVVATLMAVVVAYAITTEVAKRLLSRETGDTRRSVM